MNFLEIFKSITKKEWYLLGIIFLFLTIVTLAPLVYGVLVSPQGSTITGVQFAVPGDMPVYFSYIEQVRQGNYFLSNLFGGLDQTPAFNIFWLAIGLVAKVFLLPTLFVFHLTRIILMGFLLAVIYFLLAMIFKPVKQRIFGIIIIFFSSGLGLFLIDRLIRFPENHAIDKFNWPMDLWVPEFSIFNIIYYSPHFIASLILILGVFIFNLLFIQHYKYRYSFLASLSSLSLISFHPFHVLTIFLTIGIYLALLVIIFKKNIFHLAVHYFILTITTAPVIWYYLNLISTDWVMAVKAGQNLTPTTPLWITLFSYGFFIPLSLAGAYLLIKKNKLSPINLFIIVWAVIGFILIYSPIDYQRRLTEGLIIPLIILSLMAAYDILETKWYKKYLSSKSSITIALIIFFLPLSSIFTVAVNGYMYQNQRFLSYLDNDTIQAMEWLKDNTSSQEIVLSGITISKLIPVYSARPVYVGHGVEAPFYRQKVRSVEWFFGSNHQTDIERKFLKINKISYIFYDTSTKESGAFSFDGKPYLDKVYSNLEVEIYKVTLGQD